MARAKKFTIVLLLLTLLSSFTFAGHSASASRFTGLQASAAFLAEVDSGTILFQQNQDMRHPADGLVRVMTLLLAVSAIENGTASSSEIVEMTESAWQGIAPVSHTLGIEPGEQMSLFDLMHASFLTGAAEASNLIAERIGGSISNFVALMNNRAQELGAVNTQFANASGQHSAIQYTTAADLFIIYREAMSYPLFVEISGSHRFTLRATNVSDARNIIGTNELMDDRTQYFHRHSTSGLVSITYEGGYSFAGYAESEGMSLIVVVLGSDAIIHEDLSVTMRNFSEARRLFEWGFDNFGWHTILDVFELVGRAPVTNGAGADFVNLRPQSSIVRVLENDFPIDSFHRTVVIHSTIAGITLYAPIEAGEVLGEITISRAGVEYGTVLLIANTSIELNRLEHIRMQIVDILATGTARTVLAILFVLLTVYAALVIRYNMIRRRRLQEIRLTKQRLAEERRRNNHG